MEKSQFLEFINQINEQRKEDREREERKLQLLQHQVDALVQALSVNSSRSQVTVDESGNAVSPRNMALVIESLEKSLTEFHFDLEAGVDFNSWYARYESLFTEDAIDLDDSAKIRLLLRKLSTQCHERYINFILPKNTKDFSFEETIGTLKDIFGRKESIFSIRYKCFQYEKVKFDDWVTHASKINKQCEDFKLGSLTMDQFKCLIFISSLKSHEETEIRANLLNKLQQTSDLTLQTLVNECHRMISIKRDTTLIQSEAGTSQIIRNENKSNEVNKVNILCWNCGGAHFRNQCTRPRYNCKVCNGMGHKEEYCKKKEDLQAPNVSSKKRNQWPRSNNYDSNSPRLNVIYHVNMVDAAERRRFAIILINGVSVKLQFDTASDLTIISKAEWERIGKPLMDPFHGSAKGASADKVRILGQFSAQLEFKGETKIGKIMVSIRNDLNLMGTDMIHMFKLWNQSINYICNNVNTEFDKKLEIERIQGDFKEVFQNSLGLCNKVKVKLQLKPNAVPVFIKKRPVAFAVQEKVEKELRRLQELGIITPVTFSESSAPIVAVKKSNGNVRVCGDYSTGLNNALEPYQYPLPLPDDIFKKCAGNKWFTHLDLSDAYLQVEVDDESKKLLTINTHMGLYQVNRLQPGVKSAPGVFQQIMDTMIAGLEGVCVYLDDIIVFGKSEENHLENLQLVLKRIEDFGFHLRIEKCKFMQSSIKYLGHIVNVEGIRPDPEKIVAIKELPAPRNISELRSILGAINYYGKFITEMRKIRAPLDSLLKKDVKWEWNRDCEKSLEKFKEILSSDLMLTLYNPDFPIVLAADASNMGIGACIYHVFPDGSQKMIYHAARALTLVEQNYSQIEKEALSLIFGVKKFHRFVYGRKFTLETDHKPLLHIFGSKKGIPIYTANRLQRWALELLNYDFDIKYTSTESFGHADLLSRLINSHVKPEEEYVIASVKLEAEVRYILQENVTKIPLTLKMVQQKTKDDRLLQQVIKCVQEGWPVNRFQDSRTAQFYARRSSLSVVDGCLLFGERLVIPEEFQEKILFQLHKGHPGMERMKSIARSYVYWPKIDEEIEEFVKRCDNCARVAKSPVKVPLQSWPSTKRPYERVHIDYAGPVDGSYYLVVIDAYSKWPEIFKTSKITTLSTIKLLSEAFGRFGFPEKLISDNGTQFTSEQFKVFCRTNGIEHILTPPYHPQSNGQAERFVDTLKRAIKKIQGSDVDEILQTFLSTYRSTPNRSCPGGKSPAECFISRKIRTIFDLLKPNDDSQLEEGQSVRENQEKWFNRKHSVKARRLYPGDNIYAEVRIDNKTAWVPGIVIEQIGRVIYKVLVQARDGSDRVIKSHINQLRVRFLPQDMRSAQDVFLDLLEDSRIGLPMANVSPELARSEVIEEEDDVQIEDEVEAVSTAEEVSEGGYQLRPRDSLKPPMRLQYEK